MNGNLTLVATGAPLAGRCGDLATALAAEGWSVTTALTAAARAWIDEEALEAATGSPVRTEQRSPQAEKGHGSADVVVVCPATFNTIGKIATGIADSYVHSLLCEAVGARVPVLMVPMVKDSLWMHPSWNEHLERLAGVGVWFLDPASGTEAAAPVTSGSGNAITASFEPRWVVESLNRRRHLAS